MTLTSDPSAKRSVAAVELRGGAAAQTVKSPAKAGSAVGGLAGAIPAEVEFIMSALDAGTPAVGDRRRLARASYRVAAALTLYSDVPNGVPWQIFVKDVNSKGLGFLTRHRLPLGYGGILTIPAPHGGTMKIDCTLLRCREAVAGWFEGSMYFNREQGAFEGDLVMVDLVGGS